MWNYMAAVKHIKGSLNHIETISASILIYVLRNLHFNFVSQKYKFKVSLLVWKMDVPLTLYSLNVLIFKKTKELNITRRTPWPILDKGHKK